MSERWTVFIGASSDLALETLRQLEMQPGGRYFLHYRELSPKLELLRSKMRERAVLHQADLRDPRELELLGDSILASCGAPQAILHFAAPRLLLHRFPESTSASFQDAFAVQTLAAAGYLRKLLPAMKKQALDPGAGIGQVIFLLSEVLVGDPPKGMAEYVVGKYALLGLQRALAAEFGKPNLFFHSIAPGMIETKFLKEVPTQAIEAVRANSPEGLERVEFIAGKIVKLLKSPESLQSDPHYLR